MPEKADEHHDDGDDEHEEGNAVHAVHEFDVRVTRLVRITLADVEIGKYLVPHKDCCTCLLKLQKFGEIRETALYLQSSTAVALAKAVRY